MRVICAIVASLVLAGTTFGDTINVPADQPTIAAAINASVNGDVIAIAAGTYDEANLDPNGKAITIGSASGNLDVTIDAQQGGSVFVFQTDETSGTVIKDLVITGGSSLHGGGIYCTNNSSPTISSCTITGNIAPGRGGGIYLKDNSSPTISGCTISSNAASFGGGIFFDDVSSPTITDCTISGNTADVGGGLYSHNDSSPT
ncbi:MAG: right-handed parallel beta-helix repeat-containing protein, partial [Phycisphaerales bacterium]|nr:right-handed parallel beta-helix repeat-containing protein [Phycisphaerales bacterium]